MPRFSQILAFCVLLFFLTFDVYIPLKPNLPFNGAIILGFSYNFSSVSEEFDFSPDTPCAFTIRQVIASYCLHFLAEEVLCGQYLLCASTDSLTLPGIKLVRKNPCFSNSNNNKI